MPQSIRAVSTRVAKAFDETIGTVAVNQNQSLPPTGTHLRKTKRVHGRTQVRVLRGFSEGLRNGGLTTVHDLRVHVTRYLRLDGRPLRPSQILVFGQDNRTLHGRIHIS